MANVLIRMEIKKNSWSNDKVMKFGLIFIWSDFAE
jgi:hypothetical protein